MIHQFTLNVVRAAMVATLVVPAVGVRSVAAEDEHAVIFRVILEGPVNPTHTFAVRRQCNMTCATEDIVIVCSPPNDNYDYETCSAKTHEFTSSIEPGLTVTYALLHWTTPVLAHAGDQPREYLNASWKVPEGRQVISLRYVYPGESAAGEAPNLPDTAMAAP